MQNRTLYFGDNLKVLREKISDESFDLIYLDPPFNSNRSYNVLFREGLQESEAQIKAFEDSWHWTRESKQVFDYLVTKTNQQISNLMQALEQIIGYNDMLAYLTMMTIRLIELHRVLKSTGSLYLHCDPTASHYLKIVLDVVFGKKNFRNEIVWCYKERELSKKHFNKKHDTIFFYTKSDEYTFNYRAILESYSKDHIKAYPHIDKQGRMFRISGKKGKFVGKQGLSIEVEKQNPDLVYRDYFDKSKGVLPRDWIYIPILKGFSKEYLGYPTQKPKMLLERIIKVSSDRGDWILDPFCGCGTTVAVAEELDRKWVGIDITTLAINLIKYRLRNQFDLGRKQIFVDGLPSDVTGAMELFKKDPWQFEYWALDLINAMPAKSKDKMHGPDRGVDGVIVFHKDILNGNGLKNNNNRRWKYGKVIVQVKGGTVQRSHIATLKGDVEREKADAGILVTLQKPTRSMKEEAVDAGTFSTPLTATFEFPKIQIITIEDLLGGKKPNLPRGLVKNYYKEAQHVEQKAKNSFKIRLGLF